MAMTLTSTAFGPMAELPADHTCEGRNTSPPLAWSGVPAEAKSLALIVDDPDAPDPQAPKRVWVHWLLFNLPPDTTALAAAVRQSSLPAGTGQGLNDWQRTGWGGPCPPIGRHRYFFRLHALDVVLPELGTPTRRTLEEAMAGHVLETAELVGTYEKRRKSR